MKKSVCAILTAAGLAVRAAAVPDVTELPNVVVYASRIEETAAAMPAAVRVFEADALARSGARDLPELLNKKANVQIRTLNANPLQSHIALRGFGENAFGRVKIILDGEELNSVDLEAPNLARIPIDSVERIEVIPGPSPVLYGDGASAGVISITTDTRNYARKTSVTARGGTQGTYGANVRTKGGFEEEGVLYSAAYDYGRSDGYRERSGYDMHTVQTSLRKNFTNGSSVGLKANYFNAFYEMPGSLTYAQWKEDPRQASTRADDCRLWNYGIALDAKMRLAEDQWLYLDAAFSQKRRKARWGDYGYANEYTLFGYQASPRYVNETPLFDFDNKFTFGFDFRYDRYEVTDRSGWNNPRYAFDRSRYALFAQDEFFLTDALSLVTGARIESINNRWSRYAGLTQTSSRDVLGDYELGLVYRPTDGLKTFAKGTCFHRSAACDELSYTRNGKFLDPETGASLDLGLEYAFLETFTFDLSGYWIVMQDEIFYNPHARDYGWGWAGYNCNSPGKTERLGFDTGLSWLRDKVAEAAVRYGFVHAWFAGGQYEDNDVPLVPESRMRAEAGVWILEDLEVKGGFRYVSAQVLAGDFENGHGRFPGYALFDMGLYYTPEWAEGWKASFVLDNLLDRRYCDFAGWSDYGGAYYYPACGRSFLVTVGFSF